MHKNLRVDGQRLWDSIMTVAEISPGTEGGSHRLTLTDGDKQARDLFASWCQAEGCTIRVDDMGNMFARRAGLNNDLPPIVAGSHLDTQPHGGKFDGVYGVLSALEVVRTLNQHQVQTGAPIEIVNWTNEEGSRFAPAMLASGVYAGLFEKEFAYSRTDSDGLTFLDELKRIGYLGEHCSRNYPFGALFETHIEQGPILERNQHPIGIVMGGQGQRWFDVTVTGCDSHAGSTPMSGRKDALAAASKIILIVEDIALEYGPDAVGTVGELSLLPNSRNTIPGEVFLTIDIRNPDDKQLEQMAIAMLERIRQISNERYVSINHEEIWHNPSVKFSEDCINAITKSTEELGYAYTKMISGAGHDACQVSRVAPTAMIFVPCAGGLSHNEKESAEFEDLEAGCNVLMHSMLTMAG